MTGLELPPDWWRWETIDPEWLERLRAWRPRWWR